MIFYIKSTPELINGLIETITADAFTGFQTTQPLIFAKSAAQILSMLIATRTAVSKGGMQRLIIGIQSVEN